MSKEQPWATMLITTPSQADYAAGKEESVFITKDYESAIYFMKISDLPENPDVSKRNKYPKVCMLQDVRRAFIRVPHNAYGLNGLQFDNRYELYKYMEQFEGVTVPLWNTNQMKWYLDDSTFNQYLKERNLKYPDYPAPKPATQPCIFTVNSSDTVTVKFYSKIGKEVLQQTVSGQTEIDLSLHLPIGKYVATVFSGNKTIERRIVTVQ
jgi:hypothetical protein